jgi:hypothetical protein
MPLGVHRSVIGLLAEHAVERVDQFGRQRFLIGGVLGEGRGCRRKHQRQ